MERAGSTPAQIARFLANLKRFEQGEQGWLAESDIEPVESVPSLEELPADTAPLGQAVVIKLNGGLGTSMGLNGPKSLIEVRPGLSFLDIVVKQVQPVGVPLVLMNSFNTSQESLARLERHQLEQDLPLEFLQSQTPKIRPDLTPAEHPESHYEWCPPGHGDLYPSLKDSGLLEQLLAAGRRYAFVSNIDNLGATLDARILAWFVATGAPFLMEVTRRTPSDRKGGHLARRQGSLILRELAQCPDQDRQSFQDIRRHRYFNTNNLWLDLEAIAHTTPTLPLIVNRKPVKPDEPDSEMVIQLETAMGAAIGSLAGALALEVPRTRFAPVKTTADLLVVRSDAYHLGDDSHFEASSAELPEVALDPRHYQTIAQLEELIPHPPSLLNCRQLTINGPFRFGRQVTVEGRVELDNPTSEPRLVPDGSLLREGTSLSV
ncbi:MAG: UTP--glucose-1-phosphate uridylyltransferase [Vulcanimicrobiota bacterium]